MKNRKFVKAWQKSMKAQGLRLTLAELEILCQGFWEAVAQVVSQDGEASFVGVGKFKLIKHNPRKGWNPKTMEPVAIPERWRLKFSPSKNLVPTNGEQGVDTLR